MKANEILAIGNEIFSTSERKSIYRKEIFVECKTDKEKKNLRMKLRKKLDAFIAEFIATSKNEEKRKAKKAFAVNFDNSEDQTFVVNILSFGTQFA